MEEPKPVRSNIDTSTNQFGLATIRGSHFILGPFIHGFLFQRTRTHTHYRGAQTFLDWEHYLGVSATILTHKPSYLKDFHALGICKASLPKEATSEYVCYPFDLLLERSWKKVGDFIYPTKFKAFTLLVLGQLLLSHNRHHINGILLDILGQHL